MSSRIGSWSRPKVQDRFLKRGVITLFALAVEYGNLIGLQLKIFLQMLSQKAKGFHTFSKDDQPVISSFRIPVELAAGPQRAAVAPDIY